VRNRSYFAIGLMLALSGCGAQQVGFSDPAARSAALEKFHAGSAAMTCGTGMDCSFKWINSRAAAQRFAQAQKWDDVADVVLAAGMDVDLAWFYLGLAAQGENRTSAARVYYNMSIRKTTAGGVNACGSVDESQCEGVTLPDDATEQLASLRGTTRYSGSKKSPSTPAATPASTGFVAPAPPNSGTSSFVTPAAPASGSGGGSSGGWVAPASTKP
jgi:hypothetical protein